MVEETGVVPVSIDTLVSAPASSAEWAMFDLVARAAVDVAGTVPQDAPLGVLELVRLVRLSAAVFTVERFAGLPVGRRAEEYRLMLEAGLSICEWAFWSLLEPLEVAS